MDHEVFRATVSFIEDHHGALLLHAGAATTADGRVVVVAGPTGAGKTTLTLALTDRGLGYLTDETVCLDPATLEVTPFTKPLTVKTGAQPLLADLRPPAERIDPHSGSWHVDPSALPAAAPLPERCRPALVVLPDYRPEAADVTATPVSPARAAFLLGEESSALWAVRGRPLAALQRLVLAAPVWAVTHPDAFAAADVVVDQLLPRGPAPTLPAAVADIADTPPRVPTATRGPARAPGVDWFVVEDEAVLFDGTHLHHLDGPACATWQLLDGADPLTAIARRLSNTYDTAFERVLVDVEDLVRVLRGRGLVVEPAG